MLWPGVKRNPRNLGMHYILPEELLKKKGKEEGVGSSTGPEELKKESHAQSNSEER
jgi:hypothetical protein